jgi:hypothetical protein
LQNGYCGDLPKYIRVPENSSDEYPEKEDFIDCVKSVKFDLIAEIHKGQSRYETLDEAGSSRQ